MKKIYTDEEMLRRVWAIEEIKQLMSRRAFYIANDQRREEIDRLWVAESQNRKTASFGRNWGYYVGMDSITNYYVVRHNERRKKELAAYQQQRPELNLTEKDLGIGSFVSHPAGTPALRLAGDGKTARGLWYCIAQETQGRPDGSAESFWTAEVIGVDFILEHDGWKIWHMVIESDYFNYVGESFEQVPVYPVPGKDPIENEFGEPDIKMLTHDQIFLWADNYPPLPEEYYSFDMKDSYAPEGHPDYKKECAR